jgi:hypothetical protein
MLRGRTAGIKVGTCVEDDEEKTTPTINEGKFPEIFTGGNFPETFPTMFVHRFLLAYFLSYYLCFGKVSKESTNGDIEQQSKTWWKAGVPIGSQRTEVWARADSNRPI